MGITFEDILKVGSALVGGGVVTKVADMILSRGQMRAYAMGAVDKAVETALSSVTAQLENTDRRLEQAEAHWRDEAEHRERCEVTLEEVTRRLATQQFEINRLMAGPVMPH